MNLPTFQYEAEIKMKYGDAKEEQNKAHYSYKVYPNPKLWPNFPNNTMLEIYPSN